jgi:carbon dioxide concentrating mechanism protein CcmO
MPEKAVGAVETRGYVGLVHATDAMNKAGRVDFLRQEHIGGGYVTTLVCGDVGAVRSAVEAGVEAVQEGGNLVTSHVIPRLHPIAWEVMIDWEIPEPIAPVHAALGMVETIGYTGALEAADAGIKAADVMLANYYIVGGGYTTVIFRGDTSSVQSSVEAARECAVRVTDVKSAHVIPAPHPGLQRHLSLGTGPDLIPNLPSEPGRALGYIECRGFTALTEGSDQALKAAAVEMIAWRKVGSGMVHSVFRGEVSAVEAAVGTGAPAAGRVGERMAINVIPQPDECLTA